MFRCGRLSDWNQFEQRAEIRTTTKSESERELNKRRGVVVENFFDDLEGEVD